MIARLRRPLVLVALMLGAGFALAGIAMAFWTTSGTGTASATTGTLNPPTGVTVPGTSTGSVTVSWTASSGTPAPTGYYVTRADASNVVAGACGTGAGSLTAAGATSCTDTGLTDGSYRYTVVAVYHSWTATSSPSGTVTVTTQRHLAFSVQPSDAAAGSAITPAVKVSVLDSNNNVVTSSNAAVTVAIANNPSSGTLSGTTTVNAVSGVATFSGLSIDKAGTGYTLSASSTTMTSATSSAFAVNASTASKLVFSTQPSANATGGTAFGAQPVVTVQDAGGNTVTSDSSSVTLALTTPGGATLTCTANPKAASSGVATFAGCKIDKAGTYVLTATDGSLTSAVSTSIAVAVGSASKLAFATQPSATATAGTAFGTQPVVTVQDAGGNTVASDASSVTLALTTANGATLTCSANPKTAASGVATFAGCKIDKASTTAYTLTATDGTLSSAVSSGVTVSAGTASKLVFRVQPSMVAAGASISPAVTVEVQDASGNLTSSTANVSVAVGTNPASGVLSGTTTVTAVAGTATFSNLSINKAGVGYTLTASSSSGLTGDTSSAFNVTAGAATKLVFAQQPSNTVANSLIAPAITVQIQDANGNLTSSTANVTVAIGTNPGGSTLSGTTTVAAAGGTATFSSLSLNKAGTGYTLAASGSGLTGATSSAFNITAASITISGFSPSTQKFNSTSTITITGTGFQNGASVATTNGNATISAVSVVSSSTITLTLSNNYNNANGNKTIDLTVNNPDGGSVTKAAAISITST